jgi:hypothetical protein
MATHCTPAEVARIIEGFIEGTCGPYDWDDFISFPLDDPALEAVRQECADLPDRYPPGKRGWYCNDDGVDVLRRLMRHVSSLA